MKIALVHDHLLEFGGAERVLLALKRIFPDAHVYTAAYNPDILKKHAPDYKKWDITSSWASHIPFFKKLYSPLRFLAPLIWESFDFSQYDIVISSSGWFMSKGIITRANTKHISYVHHQPRYLYYYQTSMLWRKYWPIKIYGHFINHFLRIWDYVGSQRPDILLANSEETKRRISKFYRRDAHVVYPPVHIAGEEDVIYDKVDDYYVTTSRLTKAKKLDVLIKAANKYGFRLKIIGKGTGTGSDEAYLRDLAGDTVEFLGYIDDAEFKNMLGRARAFLFASVDEEFGIAPVEAMGYGTPVIAYASGGLKESVKDGFNGFLYKKLGSKSLIEMIKKLEQLSKKEYIQMRKNTRKEAEKYSEDVFARKMKEMVTSSD